MEKEIAKTVHKAITEKGWNLYYFQRTPNEKLDAVAIIQRGPVDLLEQGILYVIVPRVDNPTDKNETDAFLEKHQVQPQITVPQGFNYFGRCIAEFSGGSKVEYFLHPGEEVYFIGIEFQEKEIRLLASSKIFMPYDVFLSGLDSLQDITELDKIPT